MVVLLIVILSGVKFFQIMAMSLFAGKYRAQAGQVANERLDALRVLPLNLIGVSATSSLVPIPDLPSSPTNLFDPVNFPAETVTIGKKQYKYYSCVQKMKDAGANTFTPVDPDAVETGIRRVVQTVTWSGVSGLNSYQQSTVFSNTMSRPPLFDLRGVVLSTSGTPIEGAYVWVNLESYMSFSGYSTQISDLARTDSLGQYSLRVSGEQYRLFANGRVYNPFSIANVEVNETVSPVTKNLSLSQKSTGTLIGHTWYTRPVISRVVGNSGAGQEWVQFYVPNTVALPEQRFKLKFQRAVDASPIEVQLDYSPGGAAQTLGNSQTYFFANKSPITISGVNYTPVAIWKAGAPNSVNFPYFGAAQNVIPITTDGAGEGAGGIMLYDSSGTFSDSIGWGGGALGTPSQLFENAVFPLPGGLTDGFELRRYTKKGVWAAAQSPAFDTNSNSNDWTGSSPVNSNLSMAVSMVSGMPWPGTDVMERVVNYATTPLGTELTGNAASSTYTVSGSSAIFTLPTTRATVFYEFRASSHSLLSAAKYSGVAASNTPTGPVDFFLIDGTGSPGRFRVVDSGGTPFSYKFFAAAPSYAYPISFNAGAKTYCCIASGDLITVNPNRDNPDYPIAFFRAVYSSTAPAPFDFSMYPPNRAIGNVELGSGGALTDYSVTVEYLDVGYSETIKTDSAGGFNITLPPGNFRLTPATGKGEFASPTSYGPFTFVGGGGSQTGLRFIIFPGYARVKGRLTQSGVPIDGNTLVALSTGTLTADYPTIDHTTRTTGLPLYSGSVQQNGSFSISAPVGATFNLYGWKVEESGGALSVNHKLLGTVSVPAGPTDVDMGDLPW